MNWYWKVRLYGKNGMYAFAQIKTDSELRDIDVCQDFYFQLTGHKMLIEGMSKEEYPSTQSIKEAFEAVWK